MFRICLVEKGINGRAYGLSPFFRVSFATDETTLHAPMDAIAGAVAQLAVIQASLD